MVSVLWQSDGVQTCQESLVYLLFLPLKLHAQIRALAKV